MDIRGVMGKCAHFRDLGFGSTSSNRGDYDLVGFQNKTAKEISVIFCEI